jgi:PmbA protein
MNTLDSSLQLLTDLIAKATGAGADAADATFVDGVSLSQGRRLGKLENLQRAENRDLGLRVFVGTRQAIVSSSDASPAALDELIERAIAMARAVPEDPHCGLAGADQLATSIPDLDMIDNEEPSTETLEARAAEAEDAARAVAGITNSEGAEASWGRHMVAVAASNGFARGYARSSSGLFVSVLAGEDLGMERDYDHTSAVYGSDLMDPAAIGRNAGEQAVRRLGARKAETAQVPVVYHPRIANTLVSHLSSAVNGGSVARGTTFLKDKLGERILPAGVTIVDDPLRQRGMRSKPFDGEGVATRRRNLIDDGVLTTWILDLRSARQLGLETTGHASRGTSSPPSPSATNLYLEPGTLSPEELMADIKSGFYVTEVIGFGINGVTGDYSRGATGLWIEDGQPSYPVSEVTIAGNLNDMFANLTPANDLEFRYGTDAPTVRVDGMTVAGK